MKLLEESFDAALSQKKEQDNFMRGEGIPPSDGYQQKPESENYAELFGFTMAMAHVGYTFEKDAHSSENALS